MFRAGQKGLTIPAPGTQQRVPRRALNKEVWLMKKFAGLAAAGAILVALAGCAGGGGGGTADGPKPLDELVVGFAQVGAESGWRTANAENIQSSFKDAGIELKFS